jgi:hypothetical protein
LAELNQELFDCLEQELCNSWRIESKNQRRCWNAICNSSRPKLGDVTEFLIEHKIWLPGVLEKMVANSRRKNYLLRLR